MWSGSLLWILGHHLLYTWGITYSTRGASPTLHVGHHLLYTSENFYGLHGVTFQEAVCESYVECIIHFLWRFQLIIRIMKTLPCFSSVSRVRRLPNRLSSLALKTIKQWRSTVGLCICINTVSLHWLHWVCAPALTLCHSTGCIGSVHLH